MDTYGPFNFRFESERERFYDAVVESIYVVENSIKDRKERKEIGQALRVVFSIGAFSAEDVDTWSKKDPEQGAGKYRGFRSFRDLRLLKYFLQRDGSGPWSHIKKLKKYKTEARLVVFKRRGRRVTGEKVYATFEIEYD